MGVKAAVAYKAGEPLGIETVNLEGPKAGEVSVGEQEAKEQEARQAQDEEQECPTHQSQGL
jgi:hypothetical protein